MFRYDNGDGTNALLDPTSPEFRRMKNSIESMVIFFLFLRSWFILFCCRTPPDTNHLFPQFDVAFLNTSTAAGRGFVRNAVMKFRQVEDKDRVRTHKTQPGGRLQGSWRRSERHAVLGNDDHLDNNNDNDNGDNNYSSSRSGWSCSSCRRWVLTTPCSSERMLLNMGGVQNKQKIDFSETKNKCILSQETPQIHQLMILRPPWRRKIQQQQQQQLQQLLLVIIFD